MVEIGQNVARLPRAKPARNRNFPTMGGMKLSLTAEIADHDGPPTPI
jgi:hypothetical protein